MSTEERARALIERQLDGLDRLAEVGLTITGALRSAATAEVGEGESRSVVLGDLSLAYDRVARALRMTYALQSRLIADLKVLDRDPVLDANDRKARVRRIVGRVIEAEHTDLRTVGRLFNDTRERLEHDDVYGDVLKRPVSELIAQICHDLGLSPDWEGLAQDAWAREEIASGAVGSPLAAWMAGRAEHPPPADPPRSTPRAASP